MGVRRSNGESRFHQRGLYDSYCTECVSDDTPQNQSVRKDKTQVVLQVRSLFCGGERISFICPFSGHFYFERLKHPQENPPRPSSMKTASSTIFVTVPISPGWMRRRSKLEYVDPIVRLSGSKTTLSPSLNGLGSGFLLRFLAFDWLGISL